MGLGGGFAVSGVGLVSFWIEIIVVMGWEGTKVWGLSGR